MTERPMRSAVWFESHVMQANHGCDFDFLLGGSPVGTARTYG